MSKLDFHGGRKEENEEEKKSAVLEATLAQLKLSWVWAGVGLRLTNRATRERILPEYFKACQMNCLKYHMTTVIQSTP